MPISTRTYVVAPLARGVARVTLVALSVELHPPPFGWDGFCSSTVPFTSKFEFPEPHGGLSVFTTTLADVRGRGSAIPDCAGNVVRSTIWRRSLLVGCPVRFVTLSRNSIVPNVE